MKITTQVRFFLGVCFIFCGWSIVAYAAEYKCEVMSVDGTVMIRSGEQSKAAQVGDLLKAGDAVDVAEASHVDLAYDSQWNNLTRIGEDSTVKIRSIYPTGLYMSKGEILAKLKHLPNKSTFEIETPTAVAAVRGSEYLTTHRSGHTEVFNLHYSPVEVYGKLPDGLMMEKGVVLKENEMTEVGSVGEAPKAPEMTPPDQLNEYRDSSAMLETDYQKKIELGEMSNTQDVNIVEKELQEKMPQDAELIQREMTSSQSQDPIQEATGDHRTFDEGTMMAPPPTDSLGDSLDQKTDQFIEKTDQMTDSFDTKLDNISDSLDKQVENVENKSSTGTMGDGNPPPPPPSDNRIVIN